MNNQQAVVEQIVQNLAFEVEAVPKDKTIQATSISPSTPLNVKIRVRKKHEIQTQHDISSVIEAPKRAPQKVRLVSSDQTIMTFDVFMEAEFEKEPVRKPRKHMFDILKPGICLGASDEDDYAHMPSSTYSANITEPSVTSKSEGILRQNFTLRKNTYQNYSVTTQAAGQKWFFGKCKPGGCLDPPFSEDKYPYRPSSSSAQEKNALMPNVLTEERLGEDVKTDIKSNGRHSSIFDGSLFKKKKKSIDKSTNTKPLDNKAIESDSILSLYQVESTANSLSTNSIITYPPKISRDLRIGDDKIVRSRGPSEDRSKKSFNEHSEPYFIPPKGVNRLKEKDPLSSKYRSSDVSDLRSQRTDSLKMPVAIPIPIPIPFGSGEDEPGDSAENNSIIKGKVHDVNINKTESIPDDNFFEKNNLNGTELPGNADLPSDDNPIWSLKMPTTDQNLTESLKMPTAEDYPTESLKMPTAEDYPTESLKMPTAEDYPTESLKMPTVNDKPIQSLKMPTIVPIKRGSLEQQTTFNFDNNAFIDANISEINTHTVKYSDDKIKRTEILQDKLENIKMPLPIPIPLPLKFNQSERAASLKKSDEVPSQIVASEIKTTQSEQSFERKTITGNIKDTLEGSGKKTVKRKSTVLASKTNSQCSEVDSIEAKSFPKNYLRTKSDISTEGNNIPENQNIINTNRASIISAMQSNKRRDSITENKSNELVIPAEDINIKHKDDKNKDLTGIVLATQGNKRRDSRTENNSNQLVIPADDKNIKHKEDKKKDLTDIATKNYIDEISNGNKLSNSDIDEKILSVNIVQNEDSKEISRYLAPIDIVKNNEMSSVFKDDSVDKTEYKEPLIERPISDYNDEKELLSGVDDEIDNISGNISSDKEYVIEPTKPQQSNNDHPNFVINESVNFITAPVMIDKIEQSLQYRRLEEIYSKTNLSGVPFASEDHAGDVFETKLASRFADVQDYGNVIHSTISNELIGTKSIIYDTDDSLPSTSSVKHIERIASSDKRVILCADTGKGSSDIISKSSKTSGGAKDLNDETRNKLSNKNNVRSSSILSSIPSTSTLKSALKKDTISVELAFQSYLNNKNERILKTFNSVNEPTRFPNDTVTLIKSQIRLSSNEIRIPVDSDHDISIQIKKPNANQRVSISESGFENTFEDDRMKQNTTAQTSGGEIRISDAKGHHSSIENDIRDSDVIDLYEQELVPLQLIIKNLRDEIDVLAAQQIVFRDKLFCPKKNKAPRLVHSNKRCVGCLRK